MRVNQQHNPMVDIMHYQLEASIHLADALFSGTEKIDRAVLDVTHQAVDGQLKLARAVADVRDPAKMADLQIALAGRPEKTMHCQQQIMAALVEIQAEFGRSVRDYMERLSQTAASEADAVSEQVTAVRHEPSDAMMNPFTGMMSVWEQAFREASRLASENMFAARSGVESAARDAMARSMENGRSSNGHAHGTKGRARHR